MIPTNVNFSEDFANARDDIEKSYSDLAYAINGRAELWTPKLGGSTSDGAVTYTTQKGWFHRVGPLVDVWFSVVWSAHSGVGNLQLILPFEILDSGTDFWVGEVSDSSYTYAGRTHLQIIGVNNTDRSEFVASATGAARIWTAVQASGTLIGHLRYIVKQKR